uniref:Uncharacterized protein n=1 Tax=Tetraselmis chuii TaxID=63592 RepID=A0A7S1ST09_9CHLO
MVSATVPVLPAATHTTHRLVPGVDAYGHSQLADVAAACGAAAPAEEARGRRMLPGCSALTESSTERVVVGQPGKRQNPRARESTFDPVLGRYTDPRYERPESAGVRRMPQYKNMLSAEMAAGW